MFRNVFFFDISIITFASVISNFEKFKFYNFTLVTRQIFKISNNNILWKIIMDIIKENNLSVNIFKELI
ncbi:hypothetical protein GLOIN_2v1785390 [Rhizophagus irregularis DAOM 181602=DAOM 197198]|nr:hypothetical protein GLOIN_2v1785390 [Rhizophagus irregularis DAOM 181602=DAOM 197198]